MEQQNKRPQMRLIRLRTPIRVNLQRLHRLTDGLDLDALDDDRAVSLFGEVLGALETSDATVFAA